jgi:hypothetical protein
MSIIRKTLDELAIVNLMTDNQILEDVVAYFDRRKDHAAIRASVKQRYGTGIKRVQDENNPNAYIETYTKETVDIQVDSGIYEAIAIGFGQKIVGALSNLFSEPGQIFSLVHDSKEAAALEDADKLLKAHRKNGGYRSALTEADERSIETGSCAVGVTFTGGTLSYDTHIASRVRFHFPKKILETVDGVKTTRAPDRTDIEDCYVVVMRISASNEATSEEDGYLAIFGRSAEWPNGRHVQYTASQITTEIPEPGSDKIIYEYEAEGGPANPLSVMANKHPDESIPEYPLSVIHGVVKDSDTPMPTSTSLYEQSLEFDVAASHTMGKGQDAAGGANVLALDETGAGKPLPRSLSGDIVTQPGQTLEHVSKSAADAEMAYKLSKEEMVDAAAGYGVPDYMVSSEDHTVDASSGIALEVKSKPLKKQRDRRVEQNDSQILHLFNVEKWLIVAHDTIADEPTVSTLRECSQAWQPGEIRLPQNKVELMAELTQARELGLMDTIALFKKYHQLATDTEAIELYDKFQDRAKRYPPIEVVEKPKRQVGLLGTNRNNNNNSAN